MEQGDAVSEFSEETEISWYDIEVGGRQFNIASRRGEAHIRAIESLIAETLTEMGGKLEGQNPTTVSWLLAMNLADQLLTLRGEQGQDSDEWDLKLKGILERLDQVLPENGGQPQRRDESKGEKDTAAVYDRLEFF